MLTITTIQAECWTGDLSRLLVPSSQHFWHGRERESVLLNWKVVICHRSLGFDHNHASALKAHTCTSSVAFCSTSCPCTCMPADHIYTGQLLNDLAESLFQRWGGDWRQPQVEGLSNNLIWNYIVTDRPNRGHVPPEFWKPVFFEQSY